MVGVRLAIGFALLLAVLFEGLRVQMSLVAVVIIAGLAALIIQTNQQPTQLLRRQTVLDLAMLVTLIPIASLNAFVAAEPGELLPSERAALLQTGGVLLIIVALLIVAAGYLFPDDLAQMPAILLPGFLTILTLTFVLHDFRSQTVLAMIAMSYFIGAAAIALTALVAEPFRRYGPAAFYLVTVLTGAVLLNPGLGNVFDRDTLIQIYTGFMILIGLGVFILVPNPGLDLTRVLVALTPSTPPRQRNRRPRSENDDHNRNNQERSR